MIAAFGDHRPRIDATAYVPELAVVVGDVVIGPASSLWFHTVVRADVRLPESDHRFRYAPTAASSTCGTPISSAPSSSVITR